MPNIKSQIKRVEVTAIENARNNAKRTRVRNAVKKFNAAIEAKDLALAEKLLPSSMQLNLTAFITKTPLPERSQL